MNKKWYAQIKEFDFESGKIIKIGTIRKVDHETNRYVYLVIDSVSKLTHSTADTSLQARHDIRTLWGNWNTFEWL